MANSKIPYVNLSNTMNTQRLRFNQLLDSVGDVSTLTTTAGPVVTLIACALPLLRSSLLSRSLLSRSAPFRQRTQHPFPIPGSGTPDK